MPPRKKAPVKPGNMSAKEKKDLQDAILEKDERQKIKNISSVASQVQNFQRQARTDHMSKIGGVASRFDVGTNKQIIEVRKMGNSAEIKEVTRSVVKILDKLGLTIAALSKGVLHITAETAKATKDAVAQYGRAISEDISVNKQNVVAMALARTSPIFGYFVSKIFETTIFRDTIEKIKTKFQSAFSSIAEKFKKRRENRELSKEEFFEEGNSRPASAARKTKSAVQSKSTEYLKKMSEALTSKHTVYVKDVQTTKELKQLLSEITILRSSMVQVADNQKSQLEEFFSDHPMFKKIYKFLDSLNNIIGAPLKFFFKIRGGYRSDVPSGPNIFQNIFDVLGVTYAKGMHKLDIIIKYLGIMGAGIIGGPLPNPSTIKEEGTFTVWGTLKEIFKESEEDKKKRGGKPRQGGIRGKISRAKKWTKSQFTEKNIMGALAEHYDIDEETMSAAIGGILESGYLGTKINVRYRASKMKGLYSGPLPEEKKFQKNSVKYLKEIAESIKKFATESIEKLGDINVWMELSTSHLKDIRNALVSKHTIYVKDEKIHQMMEEQKSETWKEKLKKKVTESSTYKKMEKWKKSLKEGLENLPEKLGSHLKSALKTMGKDLWKILMLVGSMLGKLLGPILNPLKNILGGVKSIKGIKDFLGLGVGGKIPLGGARGLGAAAGAAYGLYSMTADTIGGVKRAGEWHGKKPGEKVSTSEKVTAGIGGALGGTGSGVGGALAGAAKGAGIGMAVGMIFPPAAPFAAIIGAVAGAILGAVGGKNIAKALQWSWNKIKSIGTAIWEAIKSPITIMLGLVEKVKDWIIDKLENTPVLGSIYKGMKAVGGAVKSGAGAVYGAAKSAVGGDQKGGVSTQTGAEKGIKLEPGVEVKGVQPGIWKKFTGMAEDYKEKTGQDIQVNSAFRSREKQEELYRTNPYAAPPGRSPHEKGRAIDIQSTDGNKLEQSGLMQKYGFYRPLSNEPWHLQQSSEVGDPIHGPIVGMKNLAHMQAVNELTSTRALLEANSDLKKSMENGLGDISKNVNASSNQISSSVTNNIMNANQGSQGGRQESDSDLESVLSGNLT